MVGSVLITSSIRGVFSFQSSSYEINLMLQAYHITSEPLLAVVGLIEETRESSSPQRGRRSRTSRFVRVSAGAEPSRDKLVQYAEYNYSAEREKVVPAWEVFLLFLSPLLNPNQNQNRSRSQSQSRSQSRYLIHFRLWSQLHHARKMKMNTNEWLISFQQFTIIIDIVEERGELICSIMNMQFKRD